MLREVTFHADRPCSEYQFRRAHHAGTRAGPRRKSTARRPPRGCTLLPRDRRDRAARRRRQLPAAAAGHVGGLRGAVALVFGLLGIAVGFEAVHYTNTVGPSGDDFTGLLTIPAGLLLLGLGAVTLWRTRRIEGNRAWRYARRVLLAVAGVVAV